MSQIDQAIWDMIGTWLLFGALNVFSCCSVWLLMSRSICHLGHDWDMADDVVLQKVDVVKEVAVRSIDVCIRCINVPMSQCPRPYLGSKLIIIRKRCRMDV